MINITNYSEHPTRIGYTVFRFNEKHRAEYFKELLINDNIKFESSIEEDEDGIHLFGVKKGDFKIAQHANYLVSARYRKKIIPNQYFRWGVIIIAIILVALAIIGALKT